MKLLDEFKAFIQRGNVIDMAVGIIVGASFQKIVDVLVKNILMPPIGVLLGGVDFSDLRIVIKKGQQGMPNVTIDYGMFFNTLVDFAIISFAIFMLIKVMNRFYKTDPKQKKCPDCQMKVPIKATRCGFCTSKISSS